MRVLALLVVSALAFAEDPAVPHVTVTGEATVVRPATEARILFTLIGQAEEAKEAKTKHKEKAEKILAALKGIAVAETDVASHEPVLAAGQGDQTAIQQAMMRGGRTDAASALVAVVSVMEVRIAATAETPLFDRAAAVLDAVLEAGAENVSSEARQYYGGATNDANGPVAPIVVFLVTDVAALREEAFAKAVEAARARGTLLAGKMGMKTGKVLSAEEASSEATAQDMSANELAAVTRISAEGPWRIDPDAVALRASVARTVRLRVELALEP